MFDFVRYSRRTPKPTGSFTCNYCGAENSFFGGIAICTNCESMTSTSQQSSAGHASAIRSIRAHNKNKEYEESIKAYDVLFGLEKDPMLLYAEALTYIEYSNYEVSRIRYDREGFMEENSMLNHHASELSAKAKLLLAKCASMISGSAVAGDAKAAAYHLFLAHLKFGDISAARVSIEGIKKLNDSMLYEYASMLLDSETGNFKSVLMHSEKLLKANWEPHIALYYSAYALFKLGRIKDSKAIVASIRNAIKSENAVHLMEAIGRS
ncbi:MAG: hypothetical protein M1360_00155 [Candidatus Marsarchaeota archaeon]|jgi:tetratricopeptide (TPR) repeat protein|nr:hypothetical protein [Candidatus Marsarchaeota archaeon]MCL5418341.1 hypothetical protein [Candidatus Marsarchaeota archaeon]